MLSTLYNDADLKNVDIRLKKKLKNLYNAEYLEKNDCFDDD